MRGGEHKLPIVLYLTDLVIMLGSLALADFLRYRLPFGTEIPPGTAFLSPALFLTTAILWTLFGWSSQLYDNRRVAWGWKGLKRVFITEILCVISLGAFLFFFKYLHFSRLLFLYFCAISLTSLLAYRLFFYWIWYRLGAAGYGVKRTLIIGSGKEANNVAQAIGRHPLSRFRVVGFVDDVASEAESKVGTLSETASLVDKMHIDEVVIALPPTRRKEAIEIVGQLQWSPVRVKLVPDFLEMAAIRATAFDLGGLPLISLREPVIGDFDRLIKRTIDICVSIAALLLSEPLMLLIALAIKLDSPGPVLFRHERIGENGKPFQFLKFRSMVSNADELLPQLIDLDKLEQPAFKIRGDTRVTKVGRVIRRLCLDELPQLYNVLKGDMSLVGPRPEITDMVKRYNSWQLKRLALKPGMTGPMQVNGAGDLPLNERVNLELAYIENYSLWEDVKIIFKTAGVVISGKGVY
ncbi:sugar transferase [Chloroflexota bacterium]